MQTQNTKTVQSVKKFKNADRIELQQDRKENERKRQNERNDLRSMKRSFE